MNHTHPHLPIQSTVTLSINWGLQSTDYTSTALNQEKYCKIPLISTGLRDHRAIYEISELRGVKL